MYILYMYDRVSILSVSSIFYWVLEQCGLFCRIYFIIYQRRRGKVICRSVTEIYVYNKI